MRMPFVEIQRINLDSVSLVIKYRSCKLAAFKKGAHVELILTYPHKTLAWPDRVGLAYVPVPVSLNSNKKQPGSESN